MIDDKIKLDVERFLTTFKTDSRAFVFCGRSGQRVFSQYSPNTGFPTFSDLFCIVLRGWGESRLMEGGSMPQPLQVTGGDDNGWYAATLPLAWDRRYKELSLRIAISGYVGKMLQLQREERAKYDLEVGKKFPYRFYPVVAKANQAWATLRKKVAAFIAA